MARRRAGSRGQRPLVVPLMRSGERLDATSLDDARARHAASVAELPESGRALHATGPAIPTIRE